MIPNNPASVLQVSSSSGLHTSCNSSRGSKYKPVAKFGGTAKSQDYPQLLFVSRVIQQTPTLCNLPIFTAWTFLLSVL